MSEPRRSLRVLVVDDSNVNRHVITEALTGSGKMTVVGHASNGEQALRMVAELEPDAVTLDVQMPKMDGFTFLRILMATRPIPVVVLSSFAHSEIVFRALELGAVDFVAKPDDLLGSNKVGWRVELVEKMLSILRQEAQPRRFEVPAEGANADRKPSPVPPKFVAAIASSTGGPGALLHVMSRLPPTFGGAIVIAQHMAPGFTRTFAERLNRTTPLAVREAQDGEPVYAGHAYVCPGGSCIILKRENGVTRVGVVAPTENDRYVPSGNRLLTTAAAVFGSRSLGIVLTGMADDGVAGARAIRTVGGTVIAESQESAVVYGMPGAVVAANLASKILPLSEIADELARPVMLRTSRTV
ncbi:MAG: chemotaxis-specific protein-glutamate methyltransferase CheB [Polyangiaceae bacterium]|nr:chemotaxis-specific protein-glutamate methyltransferase CheB [Polyangiaceae bacterium]